MLIKSDNRENTVVSFAFEYAALAIKFKTWSAQGIHANPSSSVTILGLTATKHIN